MELPKNLIFVQKVPSEVLGLDGHKRFFKPADLKRKADFIIGLLGHKKGSNRSYFVIDAEDGGFDIVAESSLNEAEEKAFQEKSIKKIQALADLVVSNMRSDDPCLITLPEMMTLDSTREGTAEIINGRLFVSSEKEAQNIVDIQQEVYRGPLVIGDRLFEVDENIKYFQVDDHSRVPQEIEIILMAFDFSKDLPAIQVSEVLPDGSLSKPVTAIASAGTMVIEDWIALVDHLKSPPELRKKFRVLAKISRRFELGRSQKVLKKITITEILF